MINHCSSLKVGYDNRLDCYAAIAKRLANAKCDVKAMRAYKCPECRKFHMTSQINWRKFAKVLN